MQIRYHWLIDGADYYQVGSSYGLLCGCFDLIEQTPDFKKATATARYVERVGTAIAQEEPKQPLSPCEDFNP